MNDNASSAAHSSHAQVIVNCNCQITSIFRPVHVSASHRAFAATGPRVWKSFPFHSQLDWTLGFRTLFYSEKNLRMGAVTSRNLQCTWCRHVVNLKYVARRRMLLFMKSGFSAFSSLLVLQIQQFCWTTTDMLLCRYSLHCIIFSAHLHRLRISVCLQSRCHDICLTLHAMWVSRVYRACTVEYCQQLDLSIRPTVGL